MFRIPLVSMMVMLCVLTGLPARADAAHGGLAAKSVSMRGLFFNPMIDGVANFPWLLWYSEQRPKVLTALQELIAETRINLIDVFILIPHTLRYPAQGNEAGQTLEQWANMTFMDNLVLFVDDCHDVGVSVELDMADNRWVPYSVDSINHLVGAPGDPWWPVADDTPWDESAPWHTQIIEYVESRARHPEAIAMWTMTGNYSLGGAEPVLWDGNSTVLSYTETFVKNVWPAFASTGQRPKGSPIMLPIFADSPYWNAHDNQRLSAFRNLKKWLVDDIGLPPDYWVMTSYPFCDPAPNGRYYFREILDILGTANASRIVSTDLKGPGHENETQDTILSIQGYSGRELLEWHFRKCAEYGFTGWWIWCYQDTPDMTSGVRYVSNEWKTDLVQAILEQMPAEGEDMPATGLTGIALLAAAGAAAFGLALRGMDGSTGKNQGRRS